MILMAPPILRKILGPRGARRFDPTAPLFVRRRISLGPDESGAMRWMEPGDPFPADRVKPMRLAALFSSRHIAHERPGDDGVDVRGRPVKAEAPPPEAAPVVEVPPASDGDPATQPELELAEPRRAAGRRRGQG